VISTAVGYAGGTTPHPDYQHIGDHSETVRVEYDPRQISFGHLLEVFWQSHDPSAGPYLSQYRNAIFFTDEEQRRQAENSAKRLAQTSGQRVRTAIEPAGRFYLAEDYHQKYLLRGAEDLFRHYQSIYPDSAQLVGSTAAARVNGYLGCNGNVDELEANLDRLGLTRPLQEKLVRNISTSCREFRGMTCPAPR